MKTLWTIFIIGQIFSAGNINWQQEHGYYEVNPIYHIFGDTHPSKEQVYLIKGLETGVIYGATKIFPKYKKKILKVSNGICFGFIIDDQRKGIAFKVCW